MKSMLVAAFLFLIAASAIGQCGITEPCYPDYDPQSGNWCRRCKFIGSEAWCVTFSADPNADDGVRQPFNGYSGCVAYNPGTPWLSYCQMSGDPCCGWDYASLRKKASATMLAAFLRGSGHSMNGARQ